jgi:hypothetical protein
MGYARLRSIAAMIVQLQPEHAAATTAAAEAGTTAQLPPLLRGGGLAQGRAMLHGSGVDCGRP